MGIRLPRIAHHNKQRPWPRSLHGHQSSSPASTTPVMPNVPRGHFAVYVGESHKTRFVVPISYLKHPLFQELLKQAEEEYGFEHPTGRLTIPCSEDAFLNVFSRLDSYRRSCKFNLSSSFLVRQSKALQETLSSA